MKQLPRMGPFGELDVSEWVGEPPASTLADLRGRVIAIECFQMLCPGCVAHGLPQAQRLAKIFDDDLVVLGLHTVFEHHDAMGRVSLEAFLYEYRITFPVAIDRPQNAGLPATMSRLGLRGTPTLLLIDKDGELRLDGFGQLDDMALGAAVAGLIAEPTSSE